MLHGICLRSQIVASGFSQINHLTVYFRILFREPALQLNRFRIAQQIILYHRSRPIIEANVDVFQKLKSWPRRNTPQTLMAETPPYCPVVLRIISS